MICFGQISQRNKSLTYCIYKNDSIAQIYFCLPCSNGGVLVIMRTVTSGYYETKVAFSNYCSNKQLKHREACIVQ